MGPAPHYTRTVSGTNLELLRSALPLSVRTTEIVKTAEFPFCWPDVTSPTMIVDAWAVMEAPLNAHAGIIENIAKRTFVVFMLSKGGHLPYSRMCAS
jgi:hypothetical protein